MSCPIHASMRLPSEKLNCLFNHPSPLIRMASQTVQSLSCHASLSRSKEWVLCGSADLSADDKHLLMKFATQIGANVSKSSDVTHNISATQEEGACTRTFKVLMSIIHGRWLLKVTWIRVCMKVM